MDVRANNSYNVLEIESLEVNLDDQDFYFDRPRMFMRYTCTFKCRLKYMDPATNEKLAIINISTESNGADNMAIVRTAIENFFNKDFHNIRTDFFNSESKCRIDRNRIDAIECNWQNQEYKDLFFHLFNSSNWSLENKTLKC